MKTNHLKMEQLIRQAIQCAGGDSSLDSTSAYLRCALSEISKVGFKRQKRHNYAEQFKEQAKKNHEKWWNQIIENAKKSTELE